ncbi:MAG: UvrD-helicase domain-containing protein [Clostridiales bacterium]|nr:UvrD-helicase domain-containing protein [Clostridiales bacterium]
MYNPEELNEIQKRAVLETDGAVLVTAGAGSGKTRLLTHRIVHLIKDLHVSPYNILAITFTNKAANEMKSRLETMTDTEGLWVFTFHACCVRILRRFIDRIGFDKTFSIYGETETKAIVKRACKDNNISDKQVKNIITAISKAKSVGISPEDYETEYRFTQNVEYVALVYSIYQKELKKNNALDYDDLLIETLRLLKSSQEAREFYQDKFRYIHIDEFQDTNKIQYQIAKILAGKHGNIFAVGDEDQCIYTWRGASIDNIFDFQRDFNPKVFKLEQNYRSSGAILALANKIIKGNAKRLEKRLWTKNTDGELPVCYAAEAEGFEADFVVKKIYELTQSDNYNYSDCAVLLRLNALTRPFEERFLQYGIPFRVYGGFMFYDRKEVRDVLAYARVSVNKNDDEAAYRIINFPSRKIGEASIEKLRTYSRISGKSVYEIVTNLDPSMGFPTALMQKLDDFGKTLKKLSEYALGSVTDYFKYLLYNVLDVNNLFTTNDDEARLENLNELFNSVREFVKNNPDAMLEDYMQRVSLYSDTDEMNGDNVVTVATVHSAKGLEYPVVFVVGLEEGVFPFIREDENKDEKMEEERRLMYVAVTRAKKRLFLSFSHVRRLYSEYSYSEPSTFLTESGLVERKKPTDGYFGDSSYGSSYGSSRGSYVSSRGQSYGGHDDYSVGPRPTYNQPFTGEYKSSYGKKLEEDKKPTPASDNKYEVGMTVLHKKFGKGKIIEIENMGNNPYAKIDFGKLGVMMFALSVAPLTIVEE